MPFGFNGPFASMFGGQTTNGGTGWTPGKFISGFGGGMGGQTTNGGGPFMQMLQGKGMVMSAMSDGTLGQGGIQSRIQAGQGPLQTLMRGYGGTEDAPDAALPATQGVYKTKGGPVNVTY